MPRWLEHRIPPPVIEAGCAALMWWLAGQMPRAQWWPRGGGLLVWAAALALALAGATITLSGIRAFARVRTTANPTAPTRAGVLVTSGIFGHTRNPMYLGMALVLTGWGVWLGNAVALPGPLLSVLLLNQLQIKPEERALRQRFGAEFDRYAARVRRWV